MIRTMRIGMFGLGMHLPYEHRNTYEDHAGVRGRKRSGKKQRFKGAVEAEYVVLGGRNAKNIKTLPPDTLLGDKKNAFFWAFASGRKGPHLGWADM